jgi:hypothetical protein
MVTNFWIITLATSEKFAATCIFEIPAKAGIWFSIDFIMFFRSRLRGGFDLDSLAVFFSGLPGS